MHQDNFISDDEALNLIIKCNDAISDNNMSIIANMDYVVVSDSPLGAGLTNTPGGHYLGKNLLTMTNDDWRTEIYQNTLDRCIKLRTTIKWLSLKFARKPSHWLIIITFQPIINKSTGNIIGFKLTGEAPHHLSIGFQGIRKIINHSKNAKREIAAQIDEWLTNRELEVLFLLFHCDNYQQISNLLSLSYGINYSASMVAKVVGRNLYNKFEVNNLESLKEAAHKLNYHKSVPISLFGEFMYPLEQL